MEHVDQTANRPGEWQNIAKVHKLGLSMILLCAGLSILWGCQIGWFRYKGLFDLQAVYFGARTLIEHHNPYSISELASVYSKSSVVEPIDSITYHMITLFVNTPGTLLLVAPLVVLPVQVAQVFWTILSAASLVLACVLMWRVGVEHAPRLSACLAGFLILNCEVVIEAGNTAALVVGLCAIATWCFLRDRFVFTGVACMAISVAMKPHDSGLVLFYFLLAGLTFRKRALQSAILAGIISLVAIVWLSMVAPGWVHDWRSNLALISTPGEINDPRPANLVTVHFPGQVICLQAVFSIISGNAKFFNIASYLVCGAIMVPWLISTFRGRNSPTRAWLALAVIVPLTPLITYHRVWDAKLLMLCIPACTMLWALRGRIGWTALVLTSLGIVFTADVPLGIFEILFKTLHLTTSTFSGQILTILIARPGQLILLAMSTFYLWVYMRKDLVLTSSSNLDLASHTADNIDASEHALV
jgi:hypothetical protein